MRTTLTLFVLSLLVISVIPGVLANDTGLGVGVDIEAAESSPDVWQCDTRVVFDDHVEPGRLFQTCAGDEQCELWERVNNYAFEGEQIMWKVLVHSKKGFEKITDVYGTVGTTQGTGNDIEVNCDFAGLAHEVDSTCNARIDQEDLTGQDLSDVAAYYDCTLTVESADSMEGEHFVTIEAEDIDGELGIMAENDYWFFNPFLALKIDGDLTFEDVIPGTSSYSSTLLVGNEAESGSGVLMDMFISGTDFFDSSSSGTSCFDPFTGISTNELRLGDGESDCDLADDFGQAGSMGSDPFCYFATGGAYSTQLDDRRDREGYVGINYANTFGNSPAYGDFYGLFNGDVEGYEIVQGPFAQGGQLGAPYFPANVLSPGAEHAVTFRLNMPEPCNGDFDTGNIFFWGEAI